MSKRMRMLAALGITAVVMTVPATAALVRRGERPLPSAPEVRLLGVDVSSHNHPIEWKAPSGLGLRFVIARATEGATRVDARYAAIRRGAQAAGLAFGAFHFARPNGKDALKEADFFVRTARVERGDLLPVLDLEDSGGLDVASLVAWVRAWLNEVEAKVGVKALIYTNAEFWRMRMGDTTAFADAGYPLYIASWGAASPVVPAEDWGGRGWTLWQNSNCGKVAGIAGCIDTDLANGNVLDSLIIG